MKIREYFFVLVICIALVFGISFLAFKSPGLTGFAVYDGSFEDEVGEVVEISEEDVLRAIGEAEEIIREMSGRGFSIIYVNDSLVQANRVLEQIRYASILNREVNASAEEKVEARDALRLINWEDLSYGDVLIYIEEIRARRDKAYDIADKIYLRENEIKDSEFEVSNASYFLELGRVAFREDRYGDAEEYLELSRVELEKERAANARAGTIQNATIYFFQKYWYVVLIALIALFLIGYYVYRKTKVRMLRAKIKRMKMEKKTLISLMKRTQIERYKKNIISGLVYNIRIKKFQERLGRIKEELPVLEGRLGKMVGGVGERVVNGGKVDGKK